MLEAGDVPEKMRMVSIPDLNWSVPLEGRGVVEREGMGVTDLDGLSPLSLGSFPKLRAEQGRKTKVVYRECTFPKFPRHLKR